MPARHLDLFTPMSPSRFEPLDGMHGVCALARDSEWRLIWCNDEYARLCGRPREALLGTTPHDVSPPKLASERIEHMRRSLQAGAMISFYQFSKGQRWHTRIWPLDADEMATEGCFIVKTPAVNDRAGENDAPAILILTSDMGDLGSLSPRELEVFYYLATGMTVTETARTLFRSPKTVARHAERIHQKLGYHNRAELVSDAVRRGVVAFSPSDWRALIESA